MGFDAAIDYKGEKLRARLRVELCPRGIDVFFDNVGGLILNDALGRLAPHARVVICGGIARYNADPRDPQSLPPGPQNYFNVVFTQATIRGIPRASLRRALRRSRRSGSPTGCAAAGCASSRTCSRASRTRRAP
ncbi:MAG: zinc-binding dehydrogenase [Steroidobacteraceae bacterium]